MLFRERLTVPLLWWVLAVAFALSLLLAIGLYLGPAWGIGVAFSDVAIAALLFARASVVIVVNAEVIRIGRAEIEHRYIARSRALDTDATRRRGGVDADARAHLVLRPYIGTAVEITLADPVDPVPYWLVSSRWPDELAAALTAARGAPTKEDAVAPQPDPAGAPDQTARPRLTE